MNCLAETEINLNHFSTMWWLKYLKSFLVLDKEPFILHSQFHVRCWTGDARSQSISSYDIEISLRLSAPLTTRVNHHSLWPFDAIWRHRTWSTLVKVMACCLTAPSHYLYKCCLIISRALCYLFIWEQFHSKCSRYLSLIWVWKLLIQDYNHTSQGSIG